MYRARHARPRFWGILGPTLLLPLLIATLLALGIFLVVALVMLALYVFGWM